MVNLSYVINGTHYDIHNVYNNENATVLFDEIEKALLTKQGSVIVTCQLVKDGVIVFEKINVFDSTDEALLTLHYQINLNSLFSND